ncbi:hypothetical protein J008_04008 [Cryptococcus neoformans]|nr:hypothetical protein C362_03656 [Cryptococcus neoformans var. grubii Bt1]OXC69652.1 hypothetical protein AYX13_01821 [Cryptococcus neoformans var. grubii]OXG22653.1 hypothetical protein C367_03954 [Cryptococcus neoformans var. grubii Ze90-1]OXH30177.1 hypothetical protein J008_04008 [Cryptococcus neoformans var. grubii]
MSRSMMDLEEELLRLWSLVGELSEQLSNNRALVTQLKARAENVKGQAVHVGTGFPLRRFNLDISNEEFHSELEAFGSHLVLENQQLQHENKQLNALLKEYEQTLETVMNKFRGVAHSSQQHDLSLHSYYTSLLQTLQTAHSSAQLHDSTSLSLLLNRLSTLLRSALRSMQGEEPESEIDVAAILPALEQAEKSYLNSHHLVSESGPSGTNNIDDEDLRGPSPTSQPTGPQSQKTISRAPAKPTRFPGFLPGSSGGYAGTEGQADWALEREMEILRLEDENRALREMLGIAEEGKVPRDEEGDDKKAKVEDEDQRRKSSLTMEELEADAALEAERSSMVASGLYEATHTAEEELEETSKRPLLAGSMLGFQTDGPPPEQAIVDELDGDGEGVPPMQ